MIVNKRPDGVPTKVPGYTKVLPFLMPTRNESTIYMSQEIEMDNALAFMKEWAEKNDGMGKVLTPMQIFLCALARTVARRPRLNRFISNQRYYQRNNISVSFVAKKSLSDDGLEVNVIMPLQPQDTITDVNDRFQRFVEKARSSEGNKSEKDVDLFDKMPHWLIKLTMKTIKWLDKHNWISKDIIRMFPFYCTVFVTNVGSIGLDAPFHHNFECGNVGIFAALGKIKKDHRVQEDGSVVSKTVMTINWTFDDRIVDGIYTGRAMNMLKKLMENPEVLAEVPEISRKNLDALALTEEGWKMWDELA